MFTDEVKGNRNFQHLGFRYAHEIQVHDLMLEWMSLHIAYHDLLIFVICKLDLQDSRIERLIFRVVQYFLVNKRQGHGVFVSAILRKVLLNMASVGDCRVLLRLRVLGSDLDSFSISRAIFSARACRTSAADSRSRGLS